MVLTAKTSCACQYSNFCDNSYSNVRIINFSSDEVYEELNRFAIQHDIPVTKTKDYQILEK